MLKLRNTKYRSHEHNYQDKSNLPRSMLWQLLLHLTYVCQVRSVFLLMKLLTIETESMKLLTIETESRLGILWDQEECNQ